MHAAAGGVGSLAVQLGQPLGAGRVIATASSEEKRALALELGADAAVDADAEDLAERAASRPTAASRSTSSSRWPAAAVFDASLTALAPFGRLVAYGIASREPNEVPTGALMRRSRAVVGFWLVALPRGAPEMVADAARTTCSRASRAASCASSRATTYPLPRPRRAHEDLQARRTTGQAPARSRALELSLAST